MFGYAIIGYANPQQPMITHDVAHDTHPHNLALDEIPTHSYPFL